MNVDKSVTETRLQMIKLFGSSIQDTITTFHFDPRTKETARGIMTIDDTIGNDMIGLAKALKTNPQKIIGGTTNDGTILIKLIMQRFSPSNGFDVHHYFEYDTPYSESSVNSLVVYTDGRLAMLSDRMRIGSIGF